MNKMILDRSNKAEIGGKYNFGPKGFPVVCIEQSLDSRTHNYFTCKLSYEEGAAGIRVKKEDTIINRDRVLIKNEGEGVGWIFYYAGIEQEKEERGRLLEVINKSKLTKK